MTEIRLRRRRRRLRLLRLAPGPDRPAPRPIGRAARARRASALCDRRVVVASRQPPPRRARRPLRPAARSGRSPPGARGERAYPRGRLRSEARASLSTRTRRAGPSARTRSAGTSSSSPPARCDEVADTHWYRPGLRRAFWRGRRRRPAPSTSTGRRRPWSSHGADGFVLAVERAGTRRELRARFVIDASGPGGFLHRAASAFPRSRFPELPATEGLYAHFTGVRRLDAMGIVAPESDAPPYPVDDAALHHVFDGGWIWVLRFAQRDRQRRGRGRAPLARELRLEEGAPAGTAFSNVFRPSRAQFAARAPATPVRSPRRVCPSAPTRRPGTAWALLPSAAAFVDPLLSTGFPLTLLGIERLAAALERRDRARGFRGRAAPSTGALTLFEADTAALLVSALYASVRRLPRLRRAHDALLRGRELRRGGAASRPAAPLGLVPFRETIPTFGPALWSCCRMALERDPARRPELLAAIRRAIEPFDVIGLSTRAGATGIPSSPRISSPRATSSERRREEIEKSSPRWAPSASVHGV